MFYILFIGELIPHRLFHVKFFQSGAAVRTQNKPEKIIIFLFDKGCEYC